MAHPFFKKIAGILTAATLCASCLPLNSIPASADKFSSPEEMLLQTKHDDFLAISYILLLEYANISVGYESTFSLKHQILLDVDNSGTIDTMDAYIILTWCAYQGAYGTLTSDAEAFLAQWDIAEQTTAATADITTTTVETTSSTALESTTILETELTVPVTDSDTTTAQAISTAVTNPITTTADVTTTSATATTSKSTTTTIITTATTTSTTIATTTSKTTTITTAPAATGAWAQKSSYQGIDVSKYQGNVDWEAVRKSGVDFALIRAGYGKYESQEDPYFDQNMRNAKKAGIACGAYWFSYATTIAEAKQEAEVFAKVIQGYQFEYPLVFDIEAEVHTKMTKEQVSAIITAFCETMEDKGYYVSLYSYASFLNTFVYQSVLEQYDIWVAHFGVSSPSYSKTAYGMWQYSSTGKVSGINGNVDLDYSYRCYPNIMTKNHLNGF